MSKPARVENAICRRDTVALKKMGCAGGREAARCRQRRADQQFADAIKRADKLSEETEAQQMARQRGEHILTPNGEPVDVDWEIRDGDGI